MYRNFLRRLFDCLSNKVNLLTAPSAAQVTISALEGSGYRQPSRGYESRRGTL